MKRSIIIQFFVVIILLFKLSGQDDILVKKDGSAIKCFVIEVGEEEVKYKKNKDGPQYSIKKNNLISITYKNGETERFSDESSSSNTSENEFSNESKQWWEDESIKKYLEATAKDVGEQLIRNCASGKIDNHVTEIFWDGVVKDPITSDITLPIIAKWKPKFTDGSGKWIKGKILISKDGSKKWVYQNDNGLTFSGCAKGLKIK